MIPNCPQCAWVSRDPRNRPRPFQIGATVHAVPEIWLIGRSQQHERYLSKAGPVAALQSALADWADHCELAP